MLGGGSHPGAGRKPKAATADKQATPKAAPAKRPAQKSEAIYVDRNGVRSKDEPANWSFGTVPPSEPPAKEYLFVLMPLDFLLQVMREEDEEKGSRIQATTLAAAVLSPQKRRNIQEGRGSRQSHPRVCIAGRAPCLGQVESEPYHCV